MTDRRKIKVFIASPSDVAVERRAFKTLIDNLNGGFGDGANVEFVPLGWEDVFATVTRRPQDLINKDIDACDLFLLVMHRRWGQSYVGDKAFTSYTEEEFFRAFARYEQTGKPAIIVLFKRVDAASEADPGDQLKPVLAFRKRLESCVLSHFFDGEAGFIEEVDKHLRAFARGELESFSPTAESIPLPSGVVEKVEQSEKAAKHEAERAEKEHKRAEAAAARAEEFALRLARQAAKAALEGRIEEARQDLARAAEGTRNPDILFLAFEFYKRTGDLAEAERMAQTCLAISGPSLLTTNTAAVYGNLGLIYRARGDLDSAEQMHFKALEIYQKLGSLEGMAINYGNLGVIYGTRNDLDQAKEMLHKALEIDEELGRSGGMAANYGNLGVIYRTQGNLDRAEEMYSKSLLLHEKRGSLQGMAINYGNLAAIYGEMGSLDQAEGMLRKGLDIDEKLGHLEGMAANYGNLGVIYESRGDHDQAVAMISNALSVYEKLGRPEGKATAYFNLGAIEWARGNKRESIELRLKSRDIYKRIGMPHQARNIQDWLDQNPPD